MNSKLALIAFIICQAYPILSQQQGTNPSQPVVPGGWFRPLYSAAAEAWRDYLIRAQQATNQFYQQWANLTGINNPAGGFGGLGGLGGFYGGGNQQQGATGQTPRPLQGIFNPANLPIGLDMSELLPGSQKPGRLGPNEQGPLEDVPDEDTTPAQPETVAPVQQPPVIQQAPPLQQVPPVQKPAPVQQVPSTAQAPVIQQAPPVQQVPVVQQAPPVPQPSIVQQQVPPVPQTIQQAPPVQQAPIIQQAPPSQQAPLQQQTQSKLPQQQSIPHTPSRPLQTLGQAANTIGMFGGASPLGWMG